MNKILQCFLAALIMMLQNTLCFEPKITIITSVYNGDQFIEGFLADITRQTIFDQCELIMINANSPGAEEPVIKKYMATYPNIIYKRLDFDPGLYGVWNLAIRIGSGKYITNANLDDRLAYNCYEVHAAELDKDPEIMLVYSDRYETTVPNETFENQTGTKFPPFPQFCKEIMSTCWPSNNPMWRRSLHDQYGYFDVRYKISGDWDMWLRAVECGAKFKKIDGYYALFYCNPNGLSKNATLKDIKGKEDEMIWARYSYFWVSNNFASYYDWANRFDRSCQGAHDTWPLALTYYLKAYSLNPKRAEPLVRIAQHYCSFGNTALGYFFARNACQLPCPDEKDVEKELYDFTRWDLLGISAWYVNAFQEGLEATKKALEYHPNDQHLKNNLKFYIEHKIASKKKVVGLIPARNESKIIEQCLRALSLYTDAIVYLDDASDDNSVAIVKSVATKYRVEKIIRKKIWKRDEPGDRNALLKAGREIGGTHFIVIDADEMLTANCLQDNWIAKQIDALQPGDRLMLNWIHLWKSPDFYRADEGWRYRYKDFAFCDDGQCCYSSEFIHTGRTPNNLSGKLRYTDGDNYGMLHFQFINWSNVVKKQSWYKCLERIRTPEKAIDVINQRYAFSMDTSHEQLLNVPTCWFQKYDFFDAELFDAQEQWRADQMKQWVKQYGKDYFAGLDFWGLELENL